MLAMSFPKPPQLSSRIVDHGTCDEIKEFCHEGESSNSGNRIDGLLDIKNTLGLAAEQNTLINALEVLLRLNCTTISPLIIEVANRIKQEQSLGAAVCSTATSHLHTPLYTLQPLGASLPQNPSSIASHQTSTTPIPRSNISHPKPIYPVHNGVNHESYTPPTWASSLPMPSSQASSTLQHRVKPFTPSTPTFTPSTPTSQVKPPSSTNFFSSFYSVGNHQLSSFGSPQLTATQNLPNVPISVTPHPSQLSETDKAKFKSKKPSNHIKKPLNAFMLYMKEMRPSVIQEYGLKESAAINQILGKRWHALNRSEQARFYELARQERALHMQLYPNWSARSNYATSSKKKRKREPSATDQTQNGDHPGSPGKKCRARYGLDKQSEWCKPCRRKKKCIRIYTDETPTSTTPNSADSSPSVSSSCTCPSGDHLATCHVRTLLANKNSELKVSVDHVPNVTITQIKDERVEQCSFIPKSEK